jgi:hypothetical protein
MSAPNRIVPLALAVFVLFVLGCFMQLHPRCSVLVSLFAGWLFLPTFDNAYPFPLLHAKVMFVPAVVLFSSVAFDGGRWRRFGPRLIDLPMADACTSMNLARSAILPWPWSRQRWPTCPCVYGKSG